MKKLVRDKIPEILERKGVVPRTYKASNSEYWVALKEKLKEEVEEFLEEENEEELADILEVVYAICDFRKMSREKLEHIRKYKRNERGGFKGRMILEDMEDV